MTFRKDIVKANEIVSKIVSKLDSHDNYDDTAFILSSPVFQFLDASIPGLFIKKSDGEITLYNIPVKIVNDRKKFFAVSKINKLYI